MKTTLSYTVSMPQALEPGKRYPVVYALHGMGSHERDIGNVISPLKEEMIILAIRGPLPMNRGYAYFTIKSFGHPDEGPFNQAVDQLKAFMEEACLTYPIDPCNQFVFGFSQGAILAMTLALSLGNRLKGIVALNGYIPTHVKAGYSIQDVTQVAFFIAHGAFDQIFPLEIGRETAAYLAERSPKVSFKVYPIGHEVSKEEREDFVGWLLEQSQGE